jgi:uncharacterized repeat protein (TIGR01451 family)
MSTATTTHQRAAGRRARLAGAGIALCLAAAPAWLLLGGSTGALASSGGDRNRGDAWVDNVGQPPGPGHEMDPHLACKDINLWGDKMADASGTYTVDGWPPSGQKAQAYPRSGLGRWSYDAKRGGAQVMDVIDVGKLIAKAVANGDAPQNRQGFHFKLQLSQDPQKHKTFWVDCPEPKTRPTPTPTPTPSGSHPALVLSKSVSPSGRVATGTLLTYTITLSNHGDGPASNVTVDDVMSGTADFTVNDGSGGTADSFNGTPKVTVHKLAAGRYSWTYATVAAGAVNRVSYTAVIRTPGSVSSGVDSFTLSDTAFAAGTNCADANVAACTVEDSVAPPASGVQAAKTTTPGTGVLRDLRLAVTVLLMLGGTGLILLGLLVRQPQVARRKAG